MENNYSYRNIWKIAFPIILGSLAQDLITIADTIFVGRLGEIELGAIAIGGIFYLSIIMLGLGFGIGLQVIIARRYGENAIESLRKIWFQGFVILFSLALFFFIVLKLSTPFLLKKIINSELVFSQAINFLNIRFWGIFAAFINIGFRSFFIGIANTKVISYTTFLMAIVNIAFNYLLIFGIGFFPKLEIVGAAYASVIAEYTALLAFVVFTIANKKLKKFRMNFTISPDIKEIAGILKISFPTMLQNFISFGAWFIFFVFVEKMGTKELAVSNIIRSIYIILLLPIMGFSSATSSLTSYCIGQNQQNMLPVIIKRSLLLCLSGIGVITLVCINFPRYIISFFTTEALLIESTIPVFYVVSVASFFLAFGFILFNAVTGTGNTITSLIIESACIAAYLIGVKIISMHNLQIHHVWGMEFIYGISMGLSSIIYLKWGKWQKKVI